MVKELHSQQRNWSENRYPHSRTQKLIRKNSTSVWLSELLACSRVCGCCIGVCELCGSFTSVSELHNSGRWCEVTDMDITWQLTGGILVSGHSQGASFSPVSDSSPPMFQLCLEQKPFCTHDDSTHGFSGSKFLGLLLCSKSVCIPSANSLIRCACKYLWADHQGQSTFCVTSKSTLAGKKQKTCWSLCHQAALATEPPTT